MRGPRRRRWLGKEEEEEEEEEENSTTSPQAPAPTAPQPYHSGGNCRGRVVRWGCVALALLWVLCVVGGAEGYGRYLTSARRPICQTVPSWGRWPENVTDSDEEYIFVGFLPTRRGTRRERLGIKIPGAFTYSAKKVNDDGILPENYKLRYEFFDTGGEEVNGSRIMVELLCRNVSAVFGPEHTCYVEGTIAQGKNLPLISYGCTDEKASKFTTFVRTNPSEIYIIRTAVAAMKHNNWTRFSVIYDKDQVSTKDTLVREAQNSNMTVNHVDEYDKERLYLILDRTKNATRIYVYVGHRNLVNQILSVMSMNGMFPPGPGPKEYLLLYIENEEYNTGDWLAYIWGDEANVEQECRKNDLLSFDQAFMVVANRKPESSDLSQMVRRYNMQPPFCLGLKNNVTRSDRPRERRSGAVGLKGQANLGPKHVPYLPSAHLYDSVQLYATVVAELYEELKGTNVTVQDIARNGKLIKDKMRNRTYESILGFSMTMNDNATSEGKYSVYLFSDCPSDTLSTCPLCLHKISDYHSENRSLDASAIRLKILDEPVCGYDGMKCDTGQHYQKQIAWVLGSILVLCLFISTILYRNWKYEQEIVGLQWRINQSDLIMSTNHVAAGSRDESHTEGFNYIRLERNGGSTDAPTPLPPSPHSSSHSSHSPSQSVQSSHISIDIS